MLTHAQIWSAIDGLAKRSGLSPSGLAKRAGLDPTTFNKSKRITSDGRARWPSTESVAKSLAATGASIDQFVALITEAGQPMAEAVPLLGFAEAGAGGYFDDGGYPAGKGWDEIPFPAVDDEHVYALKISGDSMHPAYRDGTVIIVSPSATIHRGDRVVAKTRDDGEGIEAQDRESAGIEVAQPRAPRPHPRDRGGLVGRPHRLGEPVTC
jgi:phage repressor protein C with HTH and peptisase S24 domain